MEKKMETTTMGYILGVYWGTYIPIEKKMGNTIVYWGTYMDNGKENGNYYSILGSYMDNGKENGNYYNRVYWGHIWIMEKKMETTTMGYILGLYWGYIGGILGLHWGYVGGYIGMMENNMEAIT